MKHKKIWVKSIARMTVVILLFSIFIAQSAFASGISSYTYIRKGSKEKDFNALPSPSPYEYKKSIYAKDLGVDNLSKITDLFVTDEYVYITNGESIIITDHDFNTKRVITKINNNGSEEKLTEIDGLWVTKEEELYACEPEKGRVLHFNKDWTIKRILGKPEGIILDKSIAYQPQKVSVDSLGRIYIVANNIYEGIIEMNPDGSFSRYFGKVEVSYTAGELFWRRLQSSEQRAKSKSWIPVNFTYITMDKDDFVYATVASSYDKAPIRKLNAKGINILRYPVETKIEPKGDLLFNDIGYAIPTGPSTPTSIDVNDYGVYVVLDTNRCHIFGYDDDGYMLYSFGEQGDTKGRFQNPIDLKFMDNKLLVSDRGNASIEVYEQNKYGESIHKACKYQIESDYRAAAKEWEKVLEYNPIFEYAYVGIGKALYRDGDYKKASEYFLKGQDISYYSEAFKKVRQDYISEHFTGFCIIVCVLIIIRILRKIFKKKKLKNNTVGM